MKGSAYESSRKGGRDLADIHFKVITLVAIYRKA